MNINQCQVDNGSPKSVSLEPLSSYSDSLEELEPVDYNTMNASRGGAKNVEGEGHSCDTKNRRSLRVGANRFRTG